MIMIYFTEPFKMVYKSAIFSLFTITLLLALLHLSDEVKNIGHFQSLYVPVAIVCLELLKNVAFNGFPTVPLGKQTKWMFLKCLVLIVTSILSFFILAILYGAKALSEHEETLMFSIILTACTTVHCLISMGFKDFTSLLSKHTNPQEIALNSAQVVAISSVIGCWSSAIVIPLDWDRWWQKWPIPCTVGTLLGYNAGFLISLILAYMSGRMNRSHVHKRKRQV